MRLENELSSVVEKFEVKSKSLKNLIYQLEKQR